MRTWMVLGVAALVLSLTTGCRSRGPAADCGPCATTAPNPVVNRVLAGETLTGTLPCEQGCQCFYFEGVAYTLLDYDFSASGCDGVTLKIEDPKGRPVDIGNGRGCSGIVLRETGTYKGTVCKNPGTTPACYEFKYDQRLAVPEEKQVFLDCSNRETVAFTAPRGANCVVTIRPLHDCNVIPKIITVKDPDGGRALAKEAVLPGAPAPVVDLGRSNTRILRFNAPKAGKYQVTYGAEAGTSGDVVTVVQVFPPVGPSRLLQHDQQSCGGGSCPAPTPGPIAMPAPADDCPSCRPPVAQASYRR
jgi:hypothetical protein